MFQLHDARRHAAVIGARHARGVLIAAIRLARVATVLAAGLAVAPVFHGLPLPARRTVLRRWARGLLAALGVRVSAVGVPARGPGLVVANHVSWLDVMAVAAVHPAAFVCKSEIAAWPAIGWLLKGVGTVFIRRGSFRDVWRVNLQVRARLSAWQSVAAFPEGTTTAGHEVLAFRPALFQPAAELALPVFPVALAYSSDAATYTGDTPFLRSLLSIARARGLEVHVATLKPLDTQGLTRRQIALQSHRHISTRLLGLQVQAWNRGAPRSESPALSRKRNEAFTTPS